MITQVELAELGPKWEALVDIAQKGIEICLTRDGKTIAKLVRVDSAPEAPVAHQPRADVKVIDDGPLAGSVVYEGDIISPLDEE